MHNKILFRFQKEEKKYMQIYVNLEAVFYL
jgi:hypothetical protein